MSVWDTYGARLCSRADPPGNPQRVSQKEHIQSRMQRKITASMSYQHVCIQYGGKCQERRVAIIDKSELDTKKLFSMPNEDLPHGGLVFWADNVWLITEKDAHSEFRTECVMRQCNHKLKWIDEEGKLIEKWCIVEDGTKYLIGERNAKIMTIGDARLGITVGRDSDTVKLGRGRRFLIDDPESSDPLAYQITKSNKFFHAYNKEGVFRFILNEVQRTDNDNVEMGIADYFSWHPKYERIPSDVQQDLTIPEVVEEAIEREELKPETIEETGVWL